MHRNYPSLITTFTLITAILINHTVYAESTKDDSKSGRVGLYAQMTPNHTGRYYTQAQVNKIVANLQSQIDDLKAILAGVTRSGNQIHFSGVNIHINNGSGATDGKVNGLGNLIVGYNESQDPEINQSGSHNIVVGKGNNYTSYGGLVAGLNNSIGGMYSSVSGGRNNTAYGSHTSVSGGSNNVAAGKFSSVSGGWGNRSNGLNSNVSGGRGNSAQREFSTASASEVDKWFKKMSNDRNR